MSNSAMKLGDGQKDESHKMDMSKYMWLDMLRMHHKQTFWVYWTVVLQGFRKGDKPFEHNPDRRSSELVDSPERPLAVFKASIWSMSFPWTLNVSTLVGVWLMFAHGVFVLSITARAADINHLLGVAVAIWP